MIALCRRGDLAGYRLVYERYSGPLLRFAVRILGRTQEAEDAVQETFLKLYRGIAGFRSGARFSTYLFQILRNACVDAMRKRKPIAYDVEDPQAGGGPAVPPSHELRHALVQAVDRLPGQMREAFVLFAIEGFSQDEAAEILGISVGALKTHVHRARKRLRAWLGSCPDGGTL